MATIFGSKPQFKNYDQLKQIIQSKKPKCGNLDLTQMDNLKETKLKTKSRKKIVKAIDPKSNTDQEQQRKKKRCRTKTNKLDVALNLAFHSQDETSMALPDHPFFPKYRTQESEDLDNSNNNNADESWEVETTFDVVPFYTPQTHPNLFAENAQLLRLQLIEALNQLTVEQFVSITEPLVKNHFKTFHSTKSCHEDHPFSKHPFDLCHFNISECAAFLTLINQVLNPLKKN
jgi:hypothetical protein